MKGIRFPILFPEIIKNYFANVNRPHKKGDMGRRDHYGKTICLEKI